MVIISRLDFSQTQHFGNWASFCHIMYYRALYNNLASNTGLTRFKRLNGLRTFSRFIPDKEKQIQSVTLCLDKTKTVSIINVVFIVTYNGRNHSIYLKLFVTLACQTQCLLWPF